MTHSIPGSRAALMYLLTTPLDGCRERAVFVGRVGLELESQAFFDITHGYLLRRHLLTPGNGAGEVACQVMRNSVEGVSLRHDRLLRNRINGHVVSEMVGHSSSPQRPVPSASTNSHTHSQSRSTQADEANRQAT